MAKPFRLPGIEEQQVLDELQLHLILAPQERHRWNQRVIAEHYLHHATLVGEQLRYAASYRGPWASEQLGSLRERFAHVTEFRKGQGKRHRIATVLAIAACAKMAGVIGGYSGIAS